MTHNDQETVDLLDDISWPLRTARLSIRRATMSDESALWDYRRLPEVGRWISSRPAGRADWTTILWTRLRHFLVIELDGRIIGDLMVRVEDAWAQREVAAEAKCVQAEIGWALNPAFGGRGLASEAVRESLRLCFEDLQLRRVVANAFAANEPSCRLAERVGMRRELSSVRDSLHRDLGWVNGVGYAILAEEWRTRRAQNEEGTSSTSARLHAELDRIIAGRDRNDMAPTISALLPLYEQHPEEPRVLYEVGGAYDTAGEEVTALDLYERAMAAGLHGDIRRRCALQYGSTLRNVGRLDESLAVFRRAREEFPDSVALGAFEALTLNAAGQGDAALGSILNLLADHVHSDDLDRYKPAIRGNAEYLASLDRNAPAEQA